MKHKPTHPMAINFSFLYRPMDFFLARSICWPYKFVFAGTLHSLNENEMVFGLKTLLINHDLV